MVAVHGRVVVEASQVSVLFPNIVTQSVFGV
jgi:hypothetical protein